MALLACEALTFAYPGAAVPALRGVSLTVEPGEYLLVVGPSGSGKTTLLRHLKSALAPHGARTGRVLFQGRPLEEVSRREQARRIGFVMQNPRDQIVADRVAGEMAFGLESLGCDPALARARIAEAASFFGLDGWFDRATADLSGGQCQRLNLAAVMTADPAVLVLDEPTAQLDPLAATEFMALVRRLNEELGVTVIMGEQRIEEAFASAHRVLVLEEGAVAACGEPRAVAARLFATGSPLVAALPAPVRIYHGVMGREIPGAREEAGATSAAVGPGGRVAATAPGPRASLPTIGDGTPAEDAVPAPLTVREGRCWLRRWCAERGHGAAPATPAPAEPMGRSEESGFTSPSAAEPERCSADGFGRKTGASRSVGTHGRDAALALRDVWFRYDRAGADVLRGLSLEVPRGSLCALLGGNGAGKTTLLKVAAGLSRPLRGSVRVPGCPGRRGPFPGVALLPQDPQLLFSRSTVAAELAEMAEIAKAAGGNQDEVVELCDLGGLLERHPLDLSGGEQQRAALAKVLLGSPAVLLLDEPTKGTDVLFKKRFGQLLCALTERGVAVVMASHDMEFCATWADRCVLLFQGIVSADDEPQRFFGANRFYTTAASRMSRDVFADTVTDGQVIAACGSVAAQGAEGERR